MIILRRENPIVGEEVDAEYVGEMEEEVEEITKGKDGGGSIQERFINQMKAGEGTSFLNSYDFTKVKFALGKATVGGTFDGTIHRNDNGQ